MKRKHNQRTKSGLSIVILMTVVTIFVIGPLSMFVFELTRYNLADQQLKSCVDLAALAAACSTTGSDSTSATVTQTAAMNQAAWMFSQNSIFGYPLTTTPAYTYGTAAPALSPPANQAALYFQFLNPTTKVPVAIGSDAGKICRITGAWGFVPSTAKFIGIAAGPYIIVETSDGGLPMLDVVLCLDLSGSMDDFTNVTLVQRYQSTIATNGYKIAGNGTTYTDGSGTSHPLGYGPLYYATGCKNATGCSVNATWPIDYFSASSISSPGVPCTMACDFTAHGTHSGLPATSGLNASATVYTDLVVNLDGSPQMSYGCTVTNSFGSFTFPAYSSSDGGKALGILVEASRGNLESVLTATAAHVPYATWGITPKQGWFAAYYDSVMSAQAGTPSISSGNPSPVIPLRHPIGDAIMAAENFYAVMNNDADVHFGLVCFSTSAGVNSSSTTPNASTGVGNPSALTNYNSNQIPALGYPSPDPVTAINPTIPLIPTLGAAFSNFSTTTPPPSNSVNGAIYSQGTGTAPYNITSVLAYGGTNIPDALSTAIAMHLGSKSSDAGSTPTVSGSSGTTSSKPAQNLGRPGATRAIVLFTDGLPTAGGDSYNTTTNTPSWSCSQTLASAAGTAGIPIYTIGLCMVPSLQSSQSQVLTDASGSNGIAALSKNNATFSQTTSASGLNNVFQNVARQLVQLVQ